MRNKTCCFSGHRKLPYGQERIIAKRIEYVAEKLISRGYINFITGGAVGFDTIAAEVILKLREKYPHIKLILALPCKDQYVVWNQKQRDVYGHIKKSADEIVIISDSYSKEAMLARNRYMVDNSSVCICYLVKYGGGTSHTVWYAQKNGATIINISQDNK